MRIWIVFNMASLKRFFCHSNSEHMLLFPMIILNIIFLRTSLPLRLIIFQLSGIWNSECMLMHVHAHTHTHTHTHIFYEVMWRNPNFADQNEISCLLTLSPPGSFVPFLSSSHHTWKTGIAFGLHDLMLWPYRLGSSRWQGQNSKAGMGPLGWEETKVELSTHRLFPEGRLGIKR